MYRAPHVLATRGKLKSVKVKKKITQKRKSATGGPLGGAKGPKKKDVGGRPPKDLSKTQIKELAKLAGFGLRQDQIADLFGISDRTLRRKFLEDEKVLSAYKKGKAIRASSVAENHSKCVELALLDPRYLPAMFFYEKAQMGWKETGAMEVSGPGGGPVQVQGLPDVTGMSEAEKRAVVELAKERLAKG